MHTTKVTKIWFHVFLDGEFGQARNFNVLKLYIIHWPTESFIMLKNIDMTRTKVLKRFGM